MQAQPVAADTAPKKGSVQKWENGFQIERLHVGKADGKLAKPGKKVIVKYKGTLSNGKVFDETKGNKTFSFRLGECSQSWPEPQQLLTRLVSQSFIAIECFANVSNSRQGGARQAGKE